MHKQVDEREDKVPRIEWSPKLDTGIGIIDEQHKKLVNIANDLIGAIHARRGRQAVDEIIRRLREYTVHHFHEEERYMRELGYPDLLLQEKAHYLLREQVKDFQRALYRRERVEPAEVREFIKGWLINHILNMDMKIGAWLADRKDAS